VPPNVELSGRQRHAARPWQAKMYRVPPARAWRHAVGAPLERKVRRSPDEATEGCVPQVLQTASLQANKEGGGSPARKLADVLCLDQRNRTPKHVHHRSWKSERNGGVGQNKTSVLVEDRKRCRLPAPNEELSGRQRYDARPWLAKMYRVPPPPRQNGCRFFSS
jgi:hypothetical protein